MSRSPDPLLILGNSSAKGSSAPKGRNIPAQGNALGNRPTTNPSPEGAAQEFSTDESPHGWRKTTFGELIRSVSINDKKLPAKQYAESGKFPVVDQGQKFIGGYSDDEHRVISDELPLIVFGDHTRIFKYLDRAFVPGADGIKVLKPIGVDAKWLFHIAHALDFPDKGYARHFQHLKQATVYVPPFSEQRRIVARIEELFSRLDAGVAALRHAKAQLQRYRQSVLAAAVTGHLTQAWREQHPDTENPKRTAELFGTPLPESWEYSPLKSVVNEGPRNGFSPVCGTETSGSKVLKLSATSSGRMLLNEKTTKFSVSPVDPGSHAWLHPDDVLIQRANSLELLGSTAIYKGPRDEYVYPDLMMRVRISEPITRKFLVIYLNCLPARNYFQRNATGVAGNMPKINGAMVKALPVPVPPLAEQHQIVAEVEARTTAIDHLEAELDRQITRSNRLRQSILASAFSGRLVGHHHEQHQKAYA